MPQSGEMVAMFPFGPHAGGHGGETAASPRYLEMSRERPLEPSGQFEHRSLAEGDDQEHPDAKEGEPEIAPEGRQV